MDDELLLNFEQLKISAVDKIHKIEQNVNKNLKDGINIDALDASRSRQYKRDVLGKKRKLNTNNAEANVDLPIRHILKQLDIQRQEVVKDVIQSRMDDLQKFSNQQVVKKKQDLLKKQQAFIEDIQKNESSILQVLSECDKINLKERAKSDQRHQELAERRKVHELELKAREKQIQNFHVNIIEGIKKYQQEFCLIYEQLIAVIKTCTNSDELKLSLGNDFKLLKSLPEKLDEIIIKCKTAKINEADVVEVSNVVSQIKALKKNVEQIVGRINDKKEVKAPAKDLPVSLCNNDNSLSYKQNDLIDGSKKALGTLELNIVKYASLTNLKMYTEAIEFLERHAMSFKDLETDDGQKLFNFECKKAINIPVNAISGVSSEHILDKYNKLHQLLSGQNVLVSGKLFSAASHPQGIAFCMDLLAKKFVLQGDLMVSSNPESAFCYASVIISLWNDFPVLGKLILAYFYKFCPYLVPYYIPRQVGESDEEFYKKQGYMYNDGQIEKQDKFLKRMTGIMRLYSAILITKPKKGQTNKPHNIRHGWRWLSSLLKLEPRVDITATMLHTFLETVGFEMETRYGRAFIKLIKIITKKFLPSCRQKCTGGAVTRLELLLNEYDKNKKFKQPNGYLPHHCW